MRNLKNNLKSAILLTALTFGMHFDFNGSSIATFGSDAFALVDGEKTHYATGSCKDQNGTWQATCKVVDPKGPCDTKVDPGCA